MRNLSLNSRGAILMATAMTAFTINDVCIKLLAGQVPLFQAIFLRGCAATVFIVLVGLLMGNVKMGAIPRGDWFALSLRVTAETLAAWFFISALFHMPIANISAILQVLPLTVTLGAALFFNEPVGWRRWLAILIGLAGVLLIVRPGGEGFSLYSVYALLTVICATVRDLATRRLSPETSTMTVTLLTSITVTVFAGLVSLGGEWATLDLRAGGLLTASACLIVVAYLTIVAAMRVGEVAFVAPFRYSSLLVAIFLGIVVFGDWPDRLTLLGATIVVLSGLFSFYRERKLAETIG